MKKGTRRKITIPNQSQIMDQSLTLRSGISDQFDKIKEQLPTIRSQKDSLLLSDSTQKLSRKSQKLQTNKFTNNFISKNKLGLRKVLQEQKVNNIVKNFVIKLKRNLINGIPVQFQPFSKEQQNGFLIQEGFKIPVQFEVVHSVLCIILIVIIAFVFPISIIFQNSFEQSTQLMALQCISIVFYSIQIGVNFINVKVIDGRKIVQFKDIFIDYLKRKFPIDFLCVFILIFDAIFHTKQTAYLRLLVLFKIKQCLQKLQKIQNMFINNFIKQQYWALAKVFLVNFIFAHCLAVILIAMSSIDEHKNWLMAKDAYHSPWYEQYSWAYYWGSTIMLTVGFGDIAATTYKQAICVTLIQAFSCILLAYNINCVGNLINNIRQQDIEKNKNFKIMRRLVQQNDITQQLQFKVINYIDESNNMRRKFGFQDEKQFIGNLPSQLKADFLKQSNIKIFENLRFFSSISEKSLLTLAQIIQVKIAHPEQIVFKTESRPKFVIIREGQVGYCTKKNGSQFNGIVVNLVKITKNNRPLVVDLSFLNFMVSQIKYEVKSIKYSIIYKIGLIQFIQIIKHSAFDFQHFCQSRDKSKHVIDEYQTVLCEYCPTKHHKMKCPKLHFISIPQMVMFKQLQSIQNGICQRIWTQRFQLKYQFSTPLKLRKHFKKLQQQIYKSKRINIKKPTSPQNSVYQSQYKQPQIQRQRRKTGANMPNSFEQFKKITEFEKNVMDKLFRAIRDKQQNLPCQYFWELETDTACNYKYYFVASNSSQININLNTRSSRREQKGFKSKLQVLSMIKTMKSQNCTQKLLEQ